MGLLYPAVPITACFTFFSVFGAHALRMRTEKNYREMWGSATLSLIPAAIFWLLVMGEEPEMLKRTMLLLPAGALVGGCLFAYLGYVVSDFRSAKAQQGGMPKAGDIIGGFGAGMPRSGEMPKAGDVLGGIGTGISNNGPAHNFSSPIPAPSIDHRSGKWGDVQLFNWRYTRQPWDHSARAKQYSQPCAEA
jgi:hypothetical protein